MSEQVEVNDIEPIEAGWYAYSGGAQLMIFHLRETGQWSTHFDNGTAYDCAWGYIEQALGVWDLVPIGLFAEQVCGATEWAPCDDGKPHVYRVCERPRHTDRWHRQTRDGRLWAESSGDSGPIPDGPWCEHTDDMRTPPGQTTATGGDA